MKTSVQCYMVRTTVTPDLLGRSYLETYFLAESDRDAIMDSFRYARSLVGAYSVRILKLEVLDCHLGPISEGGVPWSGVDRMLYDSNNLSDSVVEERPEFIG